MTVGELTARLEGLDLGAEIRLVTQRSYPLQSDILGVCDNVELFEGDPDADLKELDLVVYIVQGDSVGYGRKAAWAAAS